VCILQTLNLEKTNWIGHILYRNCHLKHVIEGKNRWKGRSNGKTRQKFKQVLDDLQEKRWYWKLKEEELDCTQWGPGCG
jgi:hypothetical protein